MTDVVTPKRAARRLPGDLRREEILAAAGRALADQGFLPLMFEQVAREAGASKALVYAYFPSHAALYNALLRARLGEIAQRLDRLPARGFEADAVAALLAYFDEVAAHGAVLHALMTDAYLDGKRDPACVALRDRIWRRFLRASRGYVPLPPAERVAAMALLLATPEELGRMALRGEMKRDRARALCERLSLSALRGLRDAEPT